MLASIPESNTSYGFAELHDGSSAPTWCQEIELKNFHCMRRKRPQERESEVEEPVDHNLHRYANGLLPRMPAEYSHSFSPVRRPQAHVLQSKLRLWQFKQNTFVLRSKARGSGGRGPRASPDQVNVSNASLECSPTLAALNAAAPFCVYCNCCSWQLQSAEELPLVHMAPSDCMQMSQAAIAIRVQVKRAPPARRIQRLDLDGPPDDDDKRRPSAEAAQPTTRAAPSPPGAAARRRRVRGGGGGGAFSSQKNLLAFSLGGEDRVEVLRLQTASATTPTETPTTTQSSRSLPRARGPPVEVPAAAQVVLLVDHREPVIDVCSAASIDERLASAEGVVSGGSVSGGSVRGGSGGISCQNSQNYGSNSNISCSRKSSSRFSCNPPGASLSNQETTLCQSDSAASLATPCPKGCRRAVAASLA